MAFLRRTRVILNDQLLCGVTLAAAGIAALAAGVEWLAMAALAASVPFLVVGVVLGVAARGGGRTTTSL